MHEITRVAINKMLKRKSKPKILKREVFERLFQRMEKQSSIKYLRGRSTHLQEVSSGKCRW